MKCKVCGYGPNEGVSVYRQNPTGEKGIWKCEKHDENSARKTKEIVSWLESKDNTKH